MILLQYLHLITKSHITTNSRPLTELGILFFFTHSSLREFQVRYLTLFCHFLVAGSSKWFSMGSYCRNILLMLVSSHTCPYVLYINDLSDEASCKSIIYPDDNTLYSKWDQDSDLRQQLELTSESKSELQDTTD